MKDTLNAQAKQRPMVLVGGIVWGLINVEVWEKHTHLQPLKIFGRNAKEDISGGSTYYNASDVEEIQSIIEKLKSK